MAFLRERARWDMNGLLVAKDTHKAFDFKRLTDSRLYYNGMTCTWIAHVSVVLP